MLVLVRVHLVPEFGWMICVTVFENHAEIQPM